MTSQQSRCRRYASDEKFKTDRVLQRVREALAEDGRREGGKPLRQPFGSGKMLRHLYPSIQVWGLGMLSGMRRLRLSDLSAVRVARAADCSRRTSIDWKACNFRLVPVPRYAPPKQQGREVTTIP